MASGLPARARTACVVAACQVAGSRASMDVSFASRLFRFDGEMERLVLRQQFLDEGDPVGDDARDSRRLLLRDPVRQKT